MKHFVSKSKAFILYGRLFEFVTAFKGMLLLGVLANILYALIDAGFTYLMRPFLDKGLIQLDMHFVKTIPFILLIGVTLRGIISALASYCMTSVARSVVTVLRQKVFAHTLQLPASYFEKTTSSALVSKMLYDVEQVAQVSADALTDLVQNSCLVMGLLTVMFVISWQLSMVFLIVVPFVGMIVNKTNKRVRRVSHQVQKNMGEVTEIALDAMTGFKMVRLFGAQSYENQRFVEATNRARQNDMKVAVSRALNVSGVQFIIAIGIAGIIVTAIQLTAYIHLTAGGFLAIIAAMLQLIKPMKTLTTLNTTIQRGLAGAESVFKLLDEPVESLTGKAMTRRVTGEVRFESVDYAYQNHRQVLHGVDFSIQPGEVVALVGHSGGGKSTIAHLLPRFDDPTKGRILIDGEDIQTWSLETLRAQIALVSQEVTLFNDTVARNIAYGHPSFDQAQIEQAAKLAYAHDFIMQLPDGYDTWIGEKGLMLSGGQRQRLAIARAILKDAPILILDEATSALDTESELMIQRALETIMQGRTTLVIAHRLSTIINADKILVVHHGRIVESGRAEALMQLDGHFAQLMRSQRDNTLLVPQEAFG